MKPSECGSELMIRQHRGACSAAEREEARKHWAICPSCQLNHLLGADFDEEARLEPGDDERLGRYVELAAATAGTARPRLAVRAGFRRLPLKVIYAAAAAALLCAGAAAAQLWSSWRSPSAAPAQPSVLSSNAVPRAEPRLARAVVPTLPDAPAHQPGTPTSSAAAVVPPEARQTVRAQSAASLFAQANDARRAGDKMTATAVYRQLQEAFPASAESRLSRVSLGRVLLEGGSPAAALEQFDTYLDAPGGELKLEALYGRARALGKMGRPSDEKRAWQRLLEAYPGSVYAGQAKKRLVELR